MNAILAALAPIFTLILGGWTLQRFCAVEDGFWRSAEKLTYYLFLPALLLASISRANPTGLNLPVILAVILAGPFSVTLLIALLGRWLAGCDGPSLSSMIQGTARFNTYVGLAAAKALYGIDGVAIFALCIAVTIPLTNLVAVFSLLRLAHANALIRPGLLKPLLTNPLIAGSLGGIVLNAIGGLPSPIALTFDILGAAALPIGLLCVGAGLQPTEFRRALRPLCLTSFARLIAVPCVVAGLCAWLGLAGLSQQVAVMYAALPTAPAAYILARQLGGNDSLMAAIITLQTLGAMVTMPAILLLFT